MLLRPVIPALHVGKRTALTSPPALGLGARRRLVREKMGSSFSSRGAASTSEAPAALQAADSQAEEEAEWAAFRAHQGGAAKLPFAVEARTLFALARTGVLSTRGSSGEWKEYPLGTVVEFTMLPSGEAVCAFSSLSSHTPDVRADPRVSLTVTAPGFQGLADARATVAGDLEELKDQGSVAEASSAFKAQHPGSFWVDFGDFAWFKMRTVKTARLVGGFGRIRQISAEDWYAAEPDPVAQFSAPIAAHMNKDHADSLAAMTRHVAGISVEGAAMTALDSLGLDLECRRGGQAFACRLPFSRPATSRKEVKDVIVEMTRAAQAAAG